MNNRRRLVVGFGRVRLPGLQSCILAAMALTAVLISTRGQAADTPPPVVATAPLPAVKFDPDALVARLQREEYRELDAELNAYLSAYEADTHAELAAVRAIEAFERSRPELEQHFNAWIAAYPQSYAARLARGLYYSRMAWSHRGGNYICNTPVERLDAMNKYFDRASADLNAASKLSAKPILSYAFLINIAMARGDDGQKRQLLEKALQLDPYHARGRRIYIHSLQPEWGGSYEAMTAFVQSTKRYPETPKLREIVASLESDVLSRRARDSYRAKDYKTALDYLGRAFQLSEDAGVLLMRAPTLGKLDRNQEAVDDLSKAIELNPNLTEAYMRRAQFYRILRDTKNILADARLAAERGDSVSQNLLGTMYFNGDGVKKNDKEAVKWMQMAAIQGNPDAQAAYAYMLFYGRGTRIDQIEAGEWYLRAARQGNEGARENLGLLPRFMFEVELLVLRLKRAVGMC